MVQITINGLNKHQQMIANRLWQAQTTEEANEIIMIYGKEAKTIQELILAAYLDQVVTEAPLAKNILDKIFN